MVDVVGFLAFLTNVVGNILLTRKSWHGYWVRIVSIVLWGIYGVSETSWPMIFNAVTFFCINCYGLWSWRRTA